MNIAGFVNHGFEGDIVNVEVDLRRGIPGVDIVGLPDNAVREARERVRVSIRNSGFDFPRERFLLILLPRGKEGGSFLRPFHCRGNSVCVTPDICLRCFRDNVSRGA